jgi:hypothetical protein
MALADHPKIDDAGLRRIIAAVASQVVAHDEHFYVFGEPERLARPLLFAARRGIMDATAWASWLNGFTKDPQGASLYASIEGLSRRHNLQALLLVLHVNASESKNEILRESLRKPTLDALRAIN